MTAQNAWNIPHSISTMPESLRVLADIIEWSKDNRSPLGYFAALYTKVGRRIDEAIKADKFEHPDKLRHLDVVFFNRYLDALHLWHSGSRPTLPWKLACDATGNSKLIVLQHLLLAMNAHIDLDLSIATSQAIPGDELVDFETDFNTMNLLLASIMQDVENDMALIFRLLRPINCIFRREEDMVLNFSMRLVREHAWENCLYLSALEESKQEAAVNLLAQKVGRFSQDIIDPGWLAKPVISLIRRGETGDVTQRISDLQK